MPATAMAQTDGFSNANSATGRFVLMDPLSGPTGSPKAGAASLFGGASTLGAINATYPTYSGGLATCIGLGTENANNSPGFPTTNGVNTVTTSSISPNTATAVTTSSAALYVDDLQIGIRPAWIPAGATGNPAAPNRYDSEILYIGGGRSNIAGGLAGGLSVVTPYTAGTNVGGFGQGGNRDAGAGPAFTSFASKIVTSTGAVANGAAIEAGWVNRSGGNMLTAQNDFGSATAATAAPV